MSGLLLDSAKEIYYENTNIGFIIVGDGAASNHLKKRVTEENIRNVIIIPFQDYKDISSVFSLGDVGLIISKKGVGHNSVPSKTWSYLAADRPILCSFDEDSELSNLVKKVKCGLVSEADDKESFKEAVKEFCSNTDLIKMGKNGHRYVSETLNKNKCVDEYVKVFNTLLES